MEIEPTPQTATNTSTILRCRDEAGLTTDQILSVIAIVASVFGTLIVYEVVAQVKRMRLRAKERKRESGLEAGIEAPLEMEMEVLGGFGTVTNNFTGCSIHTPPAVPKPVVLARHADAGSWPERGGGAPPYCDILGKCSSCLCWLDHYPHPKFKAYFPEPGTPVTPGRHFMWQLHSDSVAVQPPPGVRLRLAGLDS